MSKTTPIQIDADDILLKLLDNDASTNVRTRKAQVMYIVKLYYQQELKKLENNQNV